MTATAVEVFVAATLAGIHVEARGDRLRYDAPPGALTPELKRRLGQHKADILRLLAAPDGMPEPSATGEMDLAEPTQAAWQEAFDERAAIAEFDGGLSRPEAEALAFSECMHQWLRQNEPLEVLPRSAQDPSRCHLCGDDIAARSDVIVTICGRWCHIGCHERWLVERYGRATEALRAMGTATQVIHSLHTSAAKGSSLSSARASRHVG